jgi:tartrate dehydrogenase/decarboxylase/D-malate dehydrogenase
MRHEGSESLSKYNIAVIEGDGIGHEVMPEALRVLEAVGRRFDVNFAWKHFDWSCEHFLKTGRMMPEDALDQLRTFDAIFLGAVGFTSTHWEAFVGFTYLLPHKLW